MNLNQPYYIEPRSDSIDLGGQWDFFMSDSVCDTIDENKWEYKTTLPASSYHSLHESGILPDPYAGTNSKLYDFADEKVWYYRRKFTVNKSDFKGIAYLSFDGVAYYCRIWLNGNLLGEHEGMFGGPVCDVTSCLDFSGENELIAEVKACNYGIKDSFDSHNRNGENTQIVPWNIARDSVTSTGDFIVMGIWNRIRLDFVEKLHISRPYMYTKSISENSAELFLELEIADGRTEELKPYYGYDDNCYEYTRAFDNGLTGERLSETADIKITITEPDTGKVAYESLDTVHLQDFEKSLINPAYRELQFFSKTITVANPRLWYPLGLGEPYLYDVEIGIYQNGRLYDSHRLNTGIRTFESRRTAGEKYRTRWEDFRFSVNGRDFFLMGINWMPVDFLYSIDEKEYEWAIALAKNAGIQMLRVWSGGGMPETDTFYDLCDKYGIMVWQDHMIANMEDTHAFPQDILESQEAYNIYRIRNHPSLVIHCGGNEFNPYHTQNAASMFVISRILRDLDPSRIFHYTTADKGSAHIYRDMEPVWYRHIYGHLPFIGESGIHSFPSFRSLKKLVSEAECKGKLPDIASEDFVKNYPELLNHFTEYHPGRVPRMLSRCSQIFNLDNITLEDICEASHIQAYEYYTLMIQATRENYPYCGGIMPWVFKRPWATAGIQVVDGCGQPTYPYYAVSNAYKPLNICLRQMWSVIAPGEAVLLETVIFNQNNENLSDSFVSVTVFNPDMTVAYEKRCKAEKKLSFGEFVTDESFTNKCFIICADLKREDKLLSRTCYFVKCTDILSDKEVFEKYRTEASENLYFKNGPFLAEDLKSANKAVLEQKTTGTGSFGRFRYKDIKITNLSSTPAYPVTIDADNPNVRFFADVNFFLLKPSENITIRIVYDGEDTNFTVKHLNS